MLPHNNFFLHCAIPAVSHIYRGFAPLNYNITITEQLSVFKSRQVYYWLFCSLVIVKGPFPLKEQRPAAEIDP